MPETSRLKFGLRTLFIAFTVIAVWLGWNVHHVRQRWRMEQYVSSLPSRIPNGTNQAITYGPPRKPWKSLPIMWRLFGVQSVELLNMELVEYHEDDKEHIVKYFPEAVIDF